MPGVFCLILLSVYGETRRRLPLYSAVVFCHNPLSIFVLFCCSFMPETAVGFCRYLLSDYVIIRRRILS